MTSFKIDIRLLLIFIGLFTGCITSSVEHHSSTSRMLNWYERENFPKLLIAIGKVEHNETCAITLIANRPKPNGKYPGFLADVGSNLLSKQQDDRMPVFLFLDGRIIGEVTFDSQFQERLLAAATSGRASYAEDDLELCRFIGDLITGHTCLTERKEQTDGHQAADQPQ